MVPASRDPGNDLGAAIRMVQRLRDGSKEILGYGYSVEWREIRSRKLGRNLFPQQIVFSCRDDLLRLIGKCREFSAFETAVARLRSEFPELQRWIESNIASLAATATELDGLLEVVRYFRNHPRPDCFARELPLSVDTKFVEHHQSILREWLDLVLPPHAIRSDEDHFERRYGLRYVEPQLLIRFLDDQVQRELGFPCSLLSLPLHVARDWRADNLRLLIVENKVNLMTVPKLSRAIAVGGMGNGITLLQHLPWVAKVSVVYWGDIDVEGLEILSRLRAVFPQAQSALMDETTLAKWRSLLGKGTGRTPPMPPHLNENERAAFALCAEQNVRLEQERVPQNHVVEIFTT
jgi:hypothetical protein